MYVRPLIREASAWTVEHAGAKMSKKFNTENIKNIHDEWKKTYPSFVERRNNEQLASNKLDRSFGLGYHRTITDGNARHAQLNASPSIPLGSKPVSPSQVPCNNLKKVWGKAVASPGVGTSNPEDLHAENSFRFTNPEPTSNKQNKLASRQTSKHRGPRSTSNGRASKTFPQ